MVGMFCPYPVNLPVGARAIATPLDVWAILGFNIRRISGPETAETLESCLVVGVAHIILGVVWTSTGASPKTCEGQLAHIRQMIVETSFRVFIELILNLKKKLQIHISCNSLSRKFHASDTKPRSSGERTTHYHNSCSQGHSTFPNLIKFSENLPCYQNIFYTNYCKFL